MNKKDIEKERFIGALKANRGLIRITCETLRMSPGKYYKWIKDDPEFKEEVDNVLEIPCDFVENKLYDRIDAGDTTAIIFYLKTKGKKRGYNEKAVERVATDTLPVIEISDKKKLGIINNKKKYITQLLKDRGKYSSELSMQIKITAQLLIRADELANIIFSSEHRPINTSISREGDERESISPLERLYIEYAKQAQKALRALGMNTDSKELLSGEDPESGLGNLYKVMSGDDPVPRFTSIAGGE